MNQRFWNQCFDKGRLKNFVLWFFANYGEHQTVELLENLKNIGFEYATKAGISLGIDDLKIPPKKTLLMAEAEQQTRATINQYKRGEITGVERFQRLIDTWHRTSESLKQEVIDHFQTTDILNPVYMMAFSGARGNVSQVRQLVGMRGLMADPQGQILDFPIRSNFREGLTLTEYIISCYGARKGIVDTALRTANAGYLTRRLVDVAQHVIVALFDCGTKRGIVLTDMKEGNKTIYSLTNRLVGRVLAKDVENIGFRNQEISAELAVNLAKNHQKIFVRSPLTCESNQLVCQLCYGWSLAQGNLVAIGEAVGIIAAQSIGEPGTQLTMRTFHTGGVFAGDVTDQIKAPYDGIATYPRSIPGTLIRTSEGKIAFLTKSEGMIKVQNFAQVYFFYKIPPFTVLFVKNGEKVYSKQVIAQISNITKNQFKRNEAERCVNAEIDGEVFFPNLKTKELLSVLKKGEDLSMNPNGLLNKKQNQTKIEEYTNVIKKDLSKIKLEKEITDALKKGPEGPRKIEDWTSGSVLSGQIYQTPIPAHFFPKEGDYIGKTVRSAGVLSYDLEIGSRFSNSGGILNGIKWAVEKNVGFSSSFYYFKKPVFSIAMNNFCYKKTGYFFTPFVRSPYNDLYGLRTKNNDSFFITKSFRENKTKIGTHFENSQFFLEWFPKKFQTNSSGSAYKKNIENQLNLLYYKSNRDFPIFSNESNPKLTAKTKQKLDWIDADPIEPSVANEIINLVDFESQSFWIPEKTYKITNQVVKNTRIFGSSLLFKEKNILFINRQGRKRSSSKMLRQSETLIKLDFVASFENIKKNDLFKICSIGSTSSMHSVNFNSMIDFVDEQKRDRPSLLETSIQSNFLKTKSRNLECHSNFECTIRPKANRTIDDDVLIMVEKNFQSRLDFEKTFQKLSEYWTFFWTPGKKNHFKITPFLLKDKMVAQKRHSAMQFEQIAKSSNMQKKKIEANCSRKITIQIKQRNSWFYSKNKNNNCLTPFHHKKTLFPGQIFMDDIIFDKNIVYIESCFLSKENQPSLLSLAQKISEFAKQNFSNKNKNDKSGNFIKWYKNKKSRFEPKISDPTYNSENNNPTKSSAIQLEVEQLITIDPVIEYTHNDSYKKLIKVFVSNEPFETFVTYQKNHYPQKTKTYKFLKRSTDTSLSIYRHIRFRAFPSPGGLRTMSVPSSGVQMDSVDVSHPVPMESYKEPISKGKTTANCNSRLRGPNGLRRNQYEKKKTYWDVQKSTDDFVSEIYEAFSTDIHYRSEWTPNSFSKNQTIPFPWNPISDNILLKSPSKNHRTNRNFSDRTPGTHIKKTIPTILSEHDGTSWSSQNGSTILAEQFVYNLQNYYQKAFSSQFARFELSLRSLKDDFAITMLSQNRGLFPNSDEAFHTRKTYNFTSCSKPLNIQPQFIGYLQKNSVAVLTANPQISFHRSFQCDTIKFGKDFQKTLGYNTFFKSSVSSARVFSDFLFDFSLYQKTDYEQKYPNKTKIDGDKTYSTGNFIALPGIKTSTIFNRKKNPGNNFIFTNDARTAFLSPFEGEILKLTKSQCLILTNKDQISFYHEIKVDQSENVSLQILTNLEEKTSILTQTYRKNKKIYSRTVDFSLGPPKKKVFATLDSANFDFEKNKNHSIFGANIVLGEFLVYGDLLVQKMEKLIGLKKPGQIIHLNKSKITLRRTQPIFLSPNTILHSFNGDFVEKNTPLMTLPFQVLTTGDIVQGIPKIEQLFEARTTKNGRFFKESIPNFLIALYQRYKTRLPLDQAVRQSFYKIQQIIIDGVQRVYRSQGVTIADKHIEIIVKQMTSKVLVVKSGQTGFLPGEILDLDFVETINGFLIKKIRYEPIILGITKASLEVDSFLSAASFQQTTKVLSRAAIAKKRDFLKGLKENVIVGNLIPAGTGYIKEKI